MRRFITRAFAVTLFVAATCASVPFSTAQASVPVHGVAFGASALLQTLDPDVDAANAYCKSTGGLVEDRRPVFGTNGGQSTWLYLSGHAYFCQYTSKKDGSRIHLLTTTLYTTMPTLAALAYYAKVPINSKGCPGGANPSSCYCTQLGGTDQFGGATLAGGAWVDLNSKPDTQLQTCIFPDMSSIDSWGLAYHSQGIVRGIDLSKVLRYHKK